MEEYTEMSRRGGKKSHKGGRKQYTNPDEIDAQMKEEELRRQRREEQGDEGEEDISTKMRQPPRDFPSSSSEESESDSDDEDYKDKKKGVSHLIEIENPNRVKNKMKKAKDVDLNQPAAQQLSRREREEIEKQQERSKYRALHAQGKTQEARTDLARLAIIKKQREDAAKKREAAQKAKEAAKENKRK